ncbi:hypothetical protein LCGC14_1711280, partial [marine sediment metagenome]
MATDILRPNSSDSHTWSIGTGHANVDDEVTQPDAGDSDILGAFFANGDDNDVEVLGFPTISGISEVTNITVWTYGSVTTITDTPEIDVNMGGWQGYVECVINSTTMKWTSNSFNGSWNQANLDGLQVRYRADVSDISKGADSNNLDVVYVIVTYTVVAGYGHDFIGVPAANIDNVIGVPTENIDKIIG